MKDKLNKYSLVLGVAGVLSLGNAFAESSSNSLNINTEVVQSCVLDLVGSGSINGGPVTGIISGGQFVFDYNASTTTTIMIPFKYRCSVGTLFTITLDSPNKQSEGVNVFALMSENNNKLLYSADFLVGNSLSKIGTGGTQSSNMRLIVAQKQYVAPGAYTDTIYLNLTY